MYTRRATHKRINSDLIGLLPTPAKSMPIKKLLIPSHAHLNGIHFTNRCDYPANRILLSPDIFEHSSFSTVHEGQRHNINNILENRILQKLQQLKSFKQKFFLNKRGSVTHHCAGLLSKKASLVALSLNKLPKEELVQKDIELSITGRRLNERRRYTTFSADNSPRALKVITNIKRL